MKLKSKLTRRDFLRLVSAGTCGCAVHSALGPAGNMFAYADGSVGALATKKVVVVYLGGGACHSWIPIRKAFNPEWHRKMGGVNGLAFDDNTVLNGRTPVLIGEQQMLNPGLSNLKFVFDQGNGAILNRVGFYPGTEITRSHDGDTRTWQSAGKDDGSGIIGRAISGLSNPLAGVSLDGASLLVQGSGNQALSLADLDNLGETNIGSATQEVLELRQSLLDGSGDLSSGHALVVKNGMNNVRYTIDSVRSAISRPVPNVAEYANGDGFMRSCYDAARLLIADGLGVSFVSMERGGWDTHSSGRQSVYSNCDSLSKGLAALVHTLQLTGNWQNTAILTMSEFSRTFWNGAASPVAGSTNGSDHGHSGPVMVLSGAFNRPGASAIVNNPAQAAEVLAAGSYLRDVEIDFRAPYHDAFTWAGFNADSIFLAPPPTHQFTRLGLFS